MAQVKSELDEYLGPRIERVEVEDRPAATRLGVVVGGSLSKGLDVKLDRTADIETTAVGRYVVVEGRSRRFFSMITDVSLDATDARIAKLPPDLSDDFTREVMIGTNVFGAIHVAPMLMLDAQAGATEPKPVKTVPGHFAPVVEASAEDVNLIFGSGQDEGYFHVGEPLDMEDIPIYVSLKRFVERSSGVFGKSGTGKTFLTRMLLAGIVRANVAVNLVFDMHNEYGWEGQGEGNRKPKGLRQLFQSSRVAVATLDPESSDRRKSKIDFPVQIGYDRIEPEDVELLTGIFNLSDVQVGALYAIHRRLGKDWITHLLSDERHDELQKMLDANQLTESTLGAIQRKFGLFRRFGFLKPTTVDNPVDRILQYLNQGLNVVLEFGRYGNEESAYILVANYLTRRIHQAYVRRKEAALGSQADEPRPLVITIEEAHKFLDPAIAGQTIFGTIARELRKYNVTLLIVDQRPSGIDSEVMSQIGTRVTCLLDDESDIRAVFSGVSGAGELRNVLAKLDTRQQALILGHAVPMPVVVRTRDTMTPDYYASLGYVEGEDLQKKLERGKRALGRDGGGLD
ncbi:MAG TPA: ATP-binding protein [Anaerolineae bacterium]|nr:ATP-binding protein [Anaerolineae bacterium]